MTLELIPGFTLGFVEVDLAGKGYLLAGELAQAAGVSTDTLRHYERKKVLPRPVRSANGYRRYGEDALPRVMLVRRALAIGFTLDELAVILSERDRGGAPCQAVYSLAVKKLGLLEEQLRELAALRDDLTGLVGSWRKQLSKNYGRPSRLLDGLPERQRSPASPRRPPTPMKKEGKK